ncbi:hypothetical protein RHE_CH03202 [Rhizobium etli CFN 42]|uniref:Uncharacterized protein n=1 Tax=Rhizobium etli (strain ATCC 51251 / DSM 11541 / JCM 21823 / NBRC 15573 / CFN 42) TaxID=347834 RepID=Q2K5B9_RHIEC|nr:hypothetical protein RHE_CH03202 [Rhizobium etli CFN 42]
MVRGFIDVVSGQGDGGDARFSGRLATGRSGRSLISMGQIALLCQQQNVIVGNVGDSHSDFRRIAPFDLRVCNELINRLLNLFPADHHAFIITKFRNLRCHITHQIGSSLLAVTMTQIIS